MRHSALLRFAATGAVGRRTLAPASSVVGDLRRIVGADNVVDSASDKYTVDWTRKYVGGVEGGATVVVFPRSTADVSAVLAFCHEKRIGVVPQGGNTGLVGGGVPQTGGDELVLSLEKMRSIVSIDEGVLIAEAGCVLEALSAAAAEHGYLVPLDLGAKGSCMIGGNVSTNAGGLRVVRYGSLHHTVLGLEVVRADGSVLDMLRQLPKDNCGYPLKHLFIGAEGTLGVVTKVALALAPLPTHSAVALARLPSFAAVPWLLRRVRASAVSPALSAFEFLDASSITCMQAACAAVLSKAGATSVMKLRGGGAAAAAESGIPGEVLVLMEFTVGGGAEGEGEGSAAKRLGDQVDDFLGSLLESDDEDDYEYADVEEGGSGNGGGRGKAPVAAVPAAAAAWARVKDERLADAVVSRSKGQEAALWAVREQLPVCLMQLSRNPAAALPAHPPSPSPSSSPSSSSSSSAAATPSVLARLLKYDVSLRLADMDAVVLAVKRQVQREGYVVAQHTQELLALATAASEGGVVCALQFCCFGHAGDKNLHLNVVAAVGAGGTGAVLDRAQGAADRAVYKAVLARGGSVSAEHGVGQKHRAIMPAARGREELRLMGEMKRLLDPHGILNPGKVIPDGV